MNYLKTSHTAQYCLNYLRLILILKLNGILFNTFGSILILIFTRTSKMKVIGTGYITPINIILTKTEAQIMSDIFHKIKHEAEHAAHAVAHVASDVANTVEQVAVGQVANAIVDSITSATAAEVEAVAVEVLEDAVVAA